MTDILIIGAGPAGLTSAIYSLRAGLNVIVLDKFIYGGQMAISNTIENYPGFKKISGYELSVKLYEQATEFGAEIVFDEVKKVEFSNSKKSIFTPNKEYSSKAVIIASGAKRKKLGCPGENDFLGKGVSYCATCDGGFFKNKTAVVVGGGNTALEDALYLATICQKVYIIHRRDTFKAEEVLVDSVQKNNKIEIIYNCSVEKIQGNSNVELIKAHLLIEDKVIDIKTDSIFISIGTEPDIDFVKGIIETDKNGYIIASEDCICSINGVFVAGDCRTKPLRQIVTATSDGAVAAYQAVNYIKQMK